MIANIFLSILVIIIGVVAIIGVVGAVLPVIPGPVLSLMALLATYVLSDGGVSLWVLLVMVGITALVTFIDLFAPSIMTKLGGCSNYATWGAFLGSILGLFVLPWGLVLGPCVGAVIGELLHDIHMGNSIRAGLLAAASYLLTTGLKLIVCLVMLFYTCSGLWFYIGNSLVKMIG